jgi:membrane-bound lytic murein transglycosylase
MQRTERLLLLNPMEAVIGTAIAATVGGVFAYVQSIWKKAVKADVDAIINAARADAASAVATAKTDAANGIAAIRMEMEKRNEVFDRRISAWEARSAQFVTRETMAEFEKKMDRMEFRIEASINKITDRLDKLLEGRERHS